MKTNFLLARTRPPQRLTVEQVADLARQLNYQATPMARALGITRRTLGRYFHDVFGCGPREWLKQRRINDGIALLGDGYDTKEVASQLGFQDRSSLFRVFRLQLQHTPRRRGGHLGLPPVSALETGRSGQMSQSATFLSQSATSRRLLQAGAD